MTISIRRRQEARTWPYVLVMLCAWGVIFAGLFFSHFLSGLPDVRNLAWPARRRTSPCWTIVAARSRGAA